MTSQVQHTEHKDKTSPQRGPAKPVRHGPVAPAPQPDAHSLQRAIADPGKARPADILGLQRAAGNRAVTRLIQAKLTVGPAGDRYEREADRVADQVLSMQPPSASKSGGEVQRQEQPEDEVQAKPLAASITPLVQRAAEGEEDKEELQAKSDVQRRAEGGFEAGPEIEGRLAALKGGGSPLSDEVRATMEPRFGADFGGVRVHTGGEADHLNRQLSAEAFTHGQDIYMRAGKYAPGTAVGNRLLAHELAHTVQQGAGHRISRWAFGGHKMITMDTLNKPEFASQFSPYARTTLEEKSNTMDARTKNLASFVGGKFVVGPVMHRLKQKGAFPRIKSEMLNHAEEGGYHEVNKGTQVKGHIQDLAYKAVDQMRSNNPNNALGILGDALHVAEDRGAHGDGNPGTGHDPKCIVAHNEWSAWVKDSDWKDKPEAKLNYNPYFRRIDWNPDDEGINSQGYKDARDVHAPDALRTFLDALTKNEKAALLSFEKTTAHVLGRKLKSGAHFFGISR